MYLAISRVFNDTLGDSMNFQPFFIASQLAVSIVFLVYASWSDFKTREVSNTVWVAYAPIAIALSLSDLLIYEPSKLLLFGISVGVTVGFAFLLFYCGAFGGADSKALMCIAFSLPFAPIALFSPIVANSLSPISQVIFPFTIFTNGVLFAAATCIYMIIRNFVWAKRNRKKMFEGMLAKESAWKKLVILITGYRINIEKLKEKWHIFPMEDVETEGDGDLKRQLVIIPRDEGRDKIVERLSTAIQTGKIDNYVWATPGLPMLIFITAGLIFALFFGDVMWLLLRLLLV